MPIVSGEAWLIPSSAEGVTTRRFLCPPPLIRKVGLFRDFRVIQLKLSADNLSLRYDDQPTRAVYCFQ